MKKIYFILSVLFCALLTNGQSVKELYQRADNFSKTFSEKYYNGLYQTEAIAGTSFFWYRMNDATGTKFMLIDAAKQSKKSAFDHNRLASALTILLKDSIKPGKLPFAEMKFEKDLQTITFSIKNEKYSCDLNNYTITKHKKENNTQPTTYWNTVYQENEKTSVLSPDGSKEAFIVEGNIWVKDVKNGRKKALSNDGSSYEYYSSNIYWSPDSRKIVSCKYRPAGVRQLYLIASSPAEQLQPKLINKDYIKPGDALPIRRPVVFHVEEDKYYFVNVPDAEMQYNLNNIKWDESSRYFTFDVNQRGHQEYFVYKTDVNNGKLSTIVHETSPTFIHYGAVYQYKLKNSNELLWISERDGWKHLYLYDLHSGEVKKQLTKGEWIVKQVIHVDEQKRRLIFVGCGMNKDEDPYLEKYYTLEIDNGNVVALTPEKANHKVTFSTDYNYMIDNYSRVDVSPVAVLRSASDGKVLMEIEKADISAMLKAGWRTPEVFATKGRDGKTDIWGMIVRPSNFDPNKKYPVIEYIYAGPHDAFVPKSFSPSHRFSDLAELGFVVVQIDGMGTAHRSKAFHDVCWKNLKDAGFPDRILWMKAASSKYPEMDISRVGIYGSSAGGQSSTAALLFHPEFYKVGVSSCGCHDNRMDKIWWNEQWMGYPIGKHYEENSNVANAHKLQGNLMLIVGELDDNVDPASTLQVVNALIKANKEVDFVMLPGAGHTGGERFGERKRRDFFMKHLLNIEAPEWNK